MARVKSKGSVNKSAGFSDELIVQVKPAAAKQPDKKDNQDHETDNADTASGSVPVIAVIAAEATTKISSRTRIMISILPSFLGAG